MIMNNWNRGPGLLSLLLGCCFASGCIVEEEERVVPIENLSELPGASLPPLSGDDSPPGPPPPAQPSVIDPHTPWDSLGDLSGSYRLVVTRLASNCTRGPDVPFIAPVSRWSDPLDPQTEFKVWEDRYFGYLTQRGDTIALEVGEGIVFATWARESSRLIDVERIGGAGVTNYFDGFEVERSGSDELDEADIRISGESEWEFSDHHYEPGEVCQGRTHWEAERLARPPRENYRDFQIVLRWLSDSPADLDLMVEYPDQEQFLSSIDDEEDRHSDFARAVSGCYTIHSAGAAPDSGGFVAALQDTRLPYHEEVIRCSDAAYGGWVFRVANWDPDESVDYEIETFWGRGVNTGAPGERSFGTVERSIDPLTREDHYFVLTPPTSPGDFAGVILISTYYRPRPVPRPIGALTETYLEFHKAAWEGLRYASFIEQLGIPEP